MIKEVIIAVMNQNSYNRTIMNNKYFKIIKIMSFFLLFFFVITGSAFATRTNARPKMCHSNQRVISGAVEMYNMDHDKPMKTLDLDVLVKEGYMKPVTKPETSCEYKNTGDLSASGTVYCSYHGDIDGKVIPNSSYADIIRYENQQKELDKYIPRSVRNGPQFRLFTSIAPILIFIIIIIICRNFFGGESKEEDKE